MPNEALTPGAVLAGKYRVLRVLGSGGMGVVLEATHTALEQRVAIKILNARYAASPEMTARFLREARIAAQLQSDHIARVSDVGQIESGEPYIVMELLVGHDLEAELEKKQIIPVNEAVDLIVQATQGVADAHAVGLVHRDLKPANLFLARRPGRASVVKVLDFGLSKEAEGGSQKSLTGDDSVFGTPQYMSPEQVLSSKNVDARSDQHALAMILFELLTGQPPYIAETVTALVVIIATRPPPSAKALRADIPRELDLAISRALAKRPSERFEDVADFADAIARFGSPASREIAVAIRASLSSRGSFGASEPRVSNPDVVSISSQETVPFGAPTARATPAPSQTGLTSSVDFVRQSRRRHRIALLGVAGALLLVGGGILLAAFGFKSDDPTVASSADAQSSNAPSISPSASVPASAASVHVTPSPSTASSRGLGVQGPKVVPPKPPPTKPVRNMPKPSVSSVIGVFGERTK